MAKRSRKRRAPQTIIVDILKNAKDGVRKTHIMYKVGLSYKMNERYVNALKKAGFITENSGEWKTTEKGLHVIEACEICSHLLETT